MDGLGEIRLTSHGSTNTVERAKVWDYGEQRPNPSSVDFLKLVHGADGR